MKSALQKLPKTFEGLKAYALSLSSDYDTLEVKHKKLTEEKEKVQSEKNELQLKYDYLLEQFKLGRQRQFASSSEKHLLQKNLFDEAQVPPIPEDASEEKETVTYERKKHSGQAKRTPLPDYLPREEKVYDVDEAEKICACCGTEKVCFGKATSEQLKVIPPKVVVVSHQRLKYACKACEGEVSIAPKPDLFLPKSIADASLVAYTLVMKYTDHIPLYRQEAIWARYKIHLPRNTTCGWVLKAAEYCEPLYEVMKKSLLTSGYIQVDETPVQVLNEPERDNKQKSYLWVYRQARGDPLVMYAYEKTRHAHHAQAFLQGYQGYVQTDAYRGYEWLDTQEGIVHTGCMAHARRPFAELVKLSKKKSGLAFQALEKIGELYQLEAQIKTQDNDTRYHLRQAQAKPSLDALHTWLITNVNNAPPKGKLGQAMRYMLTHWDKLARYIDDGRLAIDNNKIENAIRPFALGKKNWLFAGHPNGAKAGAILYSLLISAKENGLDQHAYLTYVFEHVRGCKTDDEYLKLLPGHLSSEQRKALTLKVK